MKRHSQEEILAKLQQAQQLEGRGQSQGDICKALGISVMTFHRWRKQDGGISQPASSATKNGAAAGTGRLSEDISRQIEDLRIENGRLRKIIGDLMLEKLKLEEAAEASEPRRFPK